VCDFSNCQYLVIAKIAKIENQKQAANFGDLGNPGSLGNRTMKKRVSRI